MGAAAVLDHDVLLPPPLIQREAMRSAVGLTIVPKQQQPQSQMPS